MIIILKYFDRELGHMQKNAQNIHVQFKKPLKRIPMLKSFG